MKLTGSSHHHFIVQKNGFERCAAAPPADSARRVRLSRASRGRDTAGADRGCWHYRMTAMMPTLHLASLAILGLFTALAVENSRGAIARGRNGTRASVLVAYSVMCVCGNLYLAIAGCVGWFSAEASTTTADRMYGDSAYVRGHLLLPLVAHVASDLLMYLALPELSQPTLIVHHVLTGVLAYLALDSAYCHHYILFFVGVAELSNVPLGFVELCKLVPAVKAACPRGYSAARSLSTVSFVALRLVYWPLVTARFWRDSLELWQAPDPPAESWSASLASLASLVGYGESGGGLSLHCRSRPVTAIYLIANVVLTLMQLGWGLTLVQRKLAPWRTASGGGERRNSRDGGKGRDGGGKSTSRGDDGAAFCGFSVPTRAERVARLRTLESTRPGLVRVYRLSCFAYSLTGVIYYWNLGVLPDELRATFLMNGEAFCACLVIQGFLSYINDALGTFDLPTPPLLSRQTWNYLDRVVASTLTANAVTTALQWTQSTANAGIPDHANPLARHAALAMCFSFVSFAPSRFCEISGRMVPFLVWHSVWHYAPNLFAVTWLTQTASR